MTETPFNIKEKIDYSDGGIMSKVIRKDDMQNVTLFSMAAGTDIDDHTSTKKGFVYVIEGKGTFTLEGNPIEMVPGQFIQMDKNAVHSLKAEENTSFLLSLTD